MEKTGDKKRSLTGNYKPPSFPPVVYPNSVKQTAVKGYNAALRKIEVSKQ